MFSMEFVEYDTNFTACAFKNNFYAFGDNKIVNK